MGSRGPIGRGQGHRKQLPVLVPLPERRVDVPDPPSGLLAESRKDWHVYWDSDVARLTTPADLPALRRLWALRDRQRRFFTAVRGEMFVLGSRGQIRVNPSFDAALKLEGAILALEQRFGLTPAARARLGLQVGQLGLTLEELNRRAVESAESAEDDDEHDPLMALIVAQEQKRSGQPGEAS